MFNNLGVPTGALVYLAGPYTSKSAAEKLINMGRFFAYHYYLSLDYNVLCMPLSTMELEFSDKHKHITHQQWIDRCLSLIDASQLVAVVPQWENSSGVKKELTYAEQTGKPTVYLPDIPTDHRVYLANWLANMRNLNHPYEQAYYAYYHMRDQHDL